MLLRSKLNQMINKNNYEWFLNISAYLLLITVSLLLPIFSFSTYSILSNTTSHLGAQGSPNAWIMNVTFIILGLNTTRVLFKIKMPYIQITGTVFGVSLMMTGVFQHASFIPNYNTSIWQDQLHSLFATTTGIAFIALSFGYAFIGKERLRYTGIILGVLATALSIGMGLLPDYMGIFQRIMFYLSFFWIYFIIHPNSKKGQTN